MARTVLEVLFKKYRDSIQSNKDFRDSLNKATTHYLEEDIANMRSQISLVNTKVEAEFNKKYLQAFTVLSEQGLSDNTFGRIASTLKTKFLNHFTELKDIGVDVGHLFSNLTIASKVKAKEGVFEQKTSLRANNIEEISAKDLQDIAKTIALISSYTSVLEELDKVQNRSQLLSFLKKSSSFKGIARSTSLTSLDDIKNAVEAAFVGTKGAKGYGELGSQILSASTIAIEANTTIDMKRSITATADKVAVTFEIKAFNQFKGTVAKGIQAEFTKYLDTLMKDPDGLPKQVNAALEKAIVKELTSKEFFELFPNTTASKSPIEAIEDTVVETILTGRAKAYSAKKSITSKTKPQKTIVNLPSISLKLPKVKSSPATVARRKALPSLASLQTLLNSALAQQIKKNMGTGGETRILNLRSGRLAESAVVQRLTQSKEGMVTAFYSYMKSPYQTFEPGFKQGTPKTRDPKLLISRSIREIAAGIVGNRLRAVSI